MYVLLLTAFLAGGGWLAVRGYVTRRRGLTAAGSAVVIAGLGLFAAMSFWAEMLWFEAVGHGDRFWRLLWVQVVLAGVGAAVAALAVRVLLWRAAGTQQGPAVRWTQTVAAAGGATWGYCGWEPALLRLNGQATALTEPVLGLSTGFYLFDLPFYDHLLDLAWLIVVITAVSMAAQAGWHTATGRRAGAVGAVGLRAHALLVLGAAAAVTLAADCALGIARQLHDGNGITTGPGWTDVHVTLPVLGGLAVLTLVLGLGPLVRPLHVLLGGWAVRQLGLEPAAGAALCMWGTLAACWLLALGVAPQLVQRFVVEPNEITYERPYIARNIRYTRHGFRLQDVAERQFPAAGVLTAGMVRDNRDVLDEVRLWDWRALDAVYKQFQEIRLYYEFVDVDIDRYRIGQRYRQVMVSAREMAPDNLPAGSRTFVNRRFKYTHGYGVTLATVSDFTPEGLPNLLVKDIPPRVAHDALALARPEIYYGELTHEPVVVASAEREFDYPKGDENVYAHYTGDGGVQIANAWRKFLFGWKFDGTRFLFSGYPTRDSRIMFHRQISERVARLAPFLVLDADPYVVIARGRLYWIIDGYTTSNRYPYSEHFPLESAAAARRPPGPLALERRRQGATVNYVRNAVKVVVDAYDGAVDFYVYDEADPIIAAWQRAFPELLQPRAAMPAALRAHVRYPADFLLVQGAVYAKYHMGDPQVFYNQEDLWVRATEQYRGQTRPVEPYYVMWRRPGRAAPEFVLMQPFTPKGRQVLIGWIAGLSDEPDYGRFLAYKFPKEKRVLGPQQVETKIDQDRHLSAQLTLWDQRGSNVIRGNVLAIPIEDTLLYVEPIYLEAETAAYPELRLVALMHKDRLSYAETFDVALDRLLGDGAGGATGGRVSVPGGETAREQVQRANDAFDRYLDALGGERFEEAGEALGTLRDILRGLLEPAGERPPEMPPARPGETPSQPPQEVPGESAVTPPPGEQ